jgi:hypothetical protein
MQTSLVTLAQSCPQFIFSLLPMGRPLKTKHFPASKTPQNRQHVGALCPLRPRPVTRLANILPTPQPALPSTLTAIPPPSPPPTAWFPWTILVPGGGSMPKQRSFHPRPEWPKSVNPIGLNKRQRGQLELTPAPLFPDAPLAEKLNLRAFLKTQSQQLEINLAPPQPLPPQPLPSDFASPPSPIPPPFPPLKR